MLQRYVLIKAIGRRLLLIHLLSLVGICGPTQHSLPGNIGKVIDQCRAGFLDNGKTDQGSNGLIDCQQRTWKVKRQARSGSVCG